MTKDDMSRKTYSLSTETIKVLNGSATKVAEEFGCDPGYIHQILGQTVTDPFAKMEWLFAAAVRAGCDVSPWMNRFDAILLKYRGGEGHSIDKATAEFVDEAADVPVAKITGKSFYEQLVEVDEAMHKLQILRDSLLHAINKDKEAEGQPHARFARVK